MNKQKRVLAIHDISGLGRCSLTVALPIISSMGIETSVMPTAILSTHTGGFEDFTYRDLTEDLIKIMEHWKSIGITFDGFYSGYLGSFKQIDIVMEVVNNLKTENSLVIVDPVMADNGVLYHGFSKEFPFKMRELCAMADVMIPNMTEAAFLLGEEYIEGPYTVEYIEGLLDRLGKIGAKKIVLTGVFFDNKELGAACYDVKNNAIEYIFNDKVDKSYHGTGDVFGSALTGALMLGHSLSKSTEIAIDFTVDAIKKSKDAKVDSKFGVRFETSIPMLLDSLK